MLLEQVLDDKLPNEREVLLHAVPGMQKSPLRRVVREGFFYCLLCVDHFVQRGLTQLQIVVVQIFVIGFLKGLIGFFQFIQILMDILLFVDLNENTGDIGAVVGNAFVLSADLGKYSPVPRCILRFAAA